MNRHSDFARHAASERDKSEIMTKGSSRRGDVKSINTAAEVPASEPKGVTVGLGEGRILFAGQLENLKGTSIAVAFEDGTDPVVVAEDIEPEAAEELIKAVANTFRRR